VASSQERWAHDAALTALTLAVSSVPSATSRSTYSAIAKGSVRGMTLSKRLIQMPINSGGPMPLALGGDGPTCRDSALSPRS